MDTNIIVSVLIALVIGLLLIILFKKKVISGDMIEGTAELLQALPVTEGSGLFELILKYARTAVLTVEQLVKTGKIEPDDVARKDKAMEIIEAAAAVDEVPFNDQERQVADACIEACVQELPRNQRE